MITIWKFPLTVNDVTETKMPSGSRILTVQTQGGEPCIWAMVGTTMPMETRQFEIFGTGHPIPDVYDKERKYIGTFQLHGGALVFHLFELIALYP